MQCCFCFNLFVKNCSCIMRILFANDLNFFGNAIGSNRLKILMQISVIVYICIMVCMVAGRRNWIIWFWVYLVDGLLLPSLEWISILYNTDVMSKFWNSTGKGLQVLHHALLSSHIDGEIERFGFFLISSTTVAVP